MSLENLRALAGFLVNAPSAGESLTVCWHAGEPLAVPIPFYDQAFELLAASSRKLRQNIQTNGTLITDDWCRLFKKWSVQIGLSIDGPRAIHDRQRVDRAGRGTFDRVMRHREVTAARGPVFGHCRADPDSLESADELWRFFKAAGIRHVGFNIDEREGVHRTPSLRSAAHVTAFHRFITESQSSTTRMTNCSSGRSKTCAIICWRLPAQWLSAQTTAPAPS